MIPAGSFRKCTDTWIGYGPYARRTASSSPCSTPPRASTTSCSRSPSEKKRAARTAATRGAELRGIRWGTTEKTKALDQHNKGNIVLIGIAADEPDRLIKERAPGKTFPLAEWGITEAECLAGCYAAGYDWEGLYEKLDRVSCACCAAKNLKELRNIYNDMPEVWADLQARQSKTSRPFKGPGKSVGDLAIRFELEKEYIAAGLSITSRDFYSCLADRLKQRGGGTA